MTDINLATGSLTINHEEIPGLMPAMEMMLRVDPRALSEGSDYPSRKSLGDWAQRRDLIGSPFLVQLQDFRPRRVISKRR